MEAVDDGDDVDARARDWADDLTDKPPRMERARRLLNSALDEGLDREGALGAELIYTDDYTEGFTARLEGHEPEFEGK